MYISASTDITCFNYNRIYLCKSVIGVIIQKFTIGVRFCLSCQSHCYSPNKKLIVASLEEMCDPRSKQNKIPTEMGEASTILLQQHLQISTQLCNIY